ncbi:MAG: M23 family metallopeptidase [Microlunatus sp.]|nr:M23 family metallopeptidase [Microlunatus sp.]
MKQRPGLTIGLALALPVLLIFSLLVFVVLTQPDDDCLPGDLGGVDIPAEPVAITSRAPFVARVATWNTLHTNSTGRITEGVTTIARSADVIGVQEFNPASRRATVARAMAKRGWGMTSGNHSVPIFYNASKYKLLAQDSVKVLDVVRIEGGTAGTSIGPKSLQWVQLQDRSTGGVFFVVNHHIVPDIDRKGHPRKAPKRQEVRTTQRSAALSVISKLRQYGPVALTEDSNVDNRNDQRVQDPRFDYMQMKQARMASNWTALGMPSYGSQTSGRRLIDKVSLTMENGRFLAQKRLPSFGSDHHAVVAAIASRTTGAAAPVTATPLASSTDTLPAALTVPGWKLDKEQIQIAAAAIEVGKQLGIPERGWIVAIASGMQESGLRNLAGGDRDSVGWQQQRPSAGWGTVAQIRDVRLATRAFYGLADHTNNPGLVDIKGWEQMSIAQAAQAVQVSAFPSAYAKHEAAARAIVAQLQSVVGAGSGIDTSDSCVDEDGGGISGDCPATGLGAEAGLKPDALLALRCVKHQFPDITDIGGVRADPMPDHPSGLAVDFMIPNYQTAAGKAFGWKVAHWLQANQRQLGVKYVIFDNKIWNVERDDDGWRVYRANGQGDDSSLHYNHVHVTVFGNAAKPDGPADPVAGAWHTPVGQPSSVGCGFGCYSGHTGQDYPAPPGTEVYAVNAGTVTRSESITTSGNCAALPICGGTRISYGNLIVVKLAGGGEVTAWYAHLTERRVRVGDTVQPGQVIGTVGYQGNVRPAGPRGSHLHFETRRGGTPINPLPYLRTKGIQS